MAQILEMCIYFRQQLVLCAFVGKDWLFWFSNVQKIGLWGIKIISSLKCDLSEPMHQVLNIDSQTRKIMRH